MITNRYETLLLATTQITDDELSAIETQFDKIFSTNKGSMTSFDKWGKYKLAYQIGEHAYGIYLLARYSLPKEKSFDALKEMDRFLKIKCSETIMRSTTAKLDADAPVTYIKPDAIGTPSTDDIDIHSDKIESLLDSVDASSQESPSEKFDKITTDASTEEA